MFSGARKDYQDYKHIYLGEMVFLLEETVSFDHPARVFSWFQARAKERIPPNVPFSIVKRSFDNFMWMDRVIKGWAIVHAEDFPKIAAYWAEHEMECTWCGRKDFSTEKGRCKGCNAPR